MTQSPTIQVLHNLADTQFESSIDKGHRLLQPIVMDGSSEPIDPQEVVVRCIVQAAYLYREGGPLSALVNKWNDDKELDLTQADTDVIVSWIRETQRLLAFASPANKAIRKAVFALPRQNSSL